jgi:membrane fusion protein, multidrug efflux system
MSVQTRMNAQIMNPRLAAFGSTIIHSAFFSIPAWPALRRHALILAALTGLGACTPPTNTPPGAGATPPPPKVAVIKTRPEPFPFLQTVSGRVQARQMAEIRPQVGGLLQALFFEEGQFVKTGDRLYQIDPAPYQAQVTHTMAALEKARAQLRLRELNVRRAAELLPLKAISIQQHDEAQAAVDVAKADVSSAQASLHKARIDLENTLIRAPINGYVGRSLITTGALLVPQQKEALAVITNLDPIHVDLSHASQERARLREAIRAGDLQEPEEGAPLAVMLELEDGQPYPHRGEIVVSEVLIDPQTGSQTLRARFANPEKTLLPGMYVRAKIEYGMIPNAILLPHAALAHDPKGTAFILLVDENNIAQVRNVVAESVFGQRWRITEGLKGGEQVIVEGVQRVRPGAPVQIDAPLPHANTKE